MIDVLDAHMHTIASGHAYSTLNEMIASGKSKKLKLIGITEHTNKMPGLVLVMKYIFVILK